MSEGIQPQYFEAHSSETVRLTPIPITEADGSPTDLTGVSLYFFMARRPKSTTTVVTSVGGGANCTVAVVGDPTAGVVRVTIPNTTTDGLDGTYNWELWARDGAGQEVLLAYGTCKFLTNISSP